MPITKSRQIAKLLKLDGSIKDSLYDSDAIVTSAQIGVTPAAGTAVYSSADTLPASADNGDQALVSSTNRFYIFTNSGWYNIALINTTPYWITEANSSYDLSTTGTTTTITMLAQDSEGINIVYTATADSDFNQIATVTKDSDNGRTFTIIPTDSEGGTAVAGTGTITFRASDGVNLVSTLSSFSIVFTVTNSNYTSFLLKADASKSDAQIDLSSNSSTIGEVNQVFSYALSPYHPGGYSGYFTANNLRVYTNGNSSDFNLSNNDWTYEGWVYVPSRHTFASYPRIFGLGPYYNDAKSFGLMFTDPDHSGYMTVYWSDGTLGRKLISATTYEKDKWNHVAVCREGNAIALFYNGTRIANNASYTGTINGNDTYAYVGSTGNGSEGFIGYWKDIRLVNGSSVYDPTASSITVPNKTLTAVTNTKLLLATTPYLADASSSAHSLTDGAHSFKRRGPYDYIEYDRTTHGGSVYFYGTDDYFTVDGGYLTTNTTWWNSSGFTLETWLYKVSTSDEHTIWDNRQSGNVNGFLFRIRSGGLYLYSNNAQRAADLGENIVNKWQHVALVCSGTTGKIFQNGVQVGSDFTIPDTASHTYFGRTQNTIGAIQYQPRGAGTDYNGYMSDFRISSGSRYTGTFTPPTEAFANDGSTVFLTFKNQNNIWNTINDPILTKQGNVTASNTQRKFTTSSAVYFDGSGDYVYETWSDNTDLIHNIPWTIEGWFRFDNVSTDQHFIHAYANGGDYDGYALTLGSNSNPGTTLCFWDGATWRTFKSDMAINTWYHLAVVNDGTNAKVYVDGTQSGSTFTPSSQIKRLTSVPLSIGCYYSGTQAMAGYAQDVRISKGVARYTSNFTPPTAEFKG